MRLSARTSVVLGALIGLMVLFATDQIVPATSQWQAQMRLWLMARATGITALLILTALVGLGLLLSHPVNQTTWKLSKRVFPWHQNLFVFALAFSLIHAISLSVDPYAGVGFEGLLVPGMSSYRSVPVALGSIALYALLVTGLTARYTRLLPAGWWLHLHRLSLVVFALAWSHGIVSGTDSGSLRPVYVMCGVAVLAAASYRYWVTRRRRPSFATGLPAAGSQRPPEAGPTP
jgi:predicted ferric reductase